MSIDDEGLGFFNALSGRLEVELTETPSPISERLTNLAAPASAALVSVELRLEVYENETFRPLTDGEWRRVALRAPRLRMRGEGGEVVEHAAPDGKAFTVRDLAAAVEETERQGRGRSEWLGGIDVHHVFFEGIHLGDDGVWSIDWGS